MSEGATPGYSQQEMSTRRRLRACKTRCEELAADVQQLMEAGAQLVEQRDKAVESLLMCQAEINRLNAELERAKAKK